MIVERGDVAFVVVVPWNESDGGLVYRLGWQNVTAIKVVKRHGPMDWLPYLEVWQGDHLHAEVAQHQALTVEFTVRDTDGSPEGTDPQGQDGEAATAGAAGIAKPQSDPTNA